MSTKLKFVSKKNEKNHLNQQFDKLKNATSLKIQLAGEKIYPDCSLSVGTCWLSITPEQLEQIRLILISSI